MAHGQMRLVEPEAAGAKCGVVQLLPLGAVEGDAPPQQVGDPPRPAGECTLQFTRWRILRPAPVGAPLPSVAAAVVPGF